ncbi:arylesterase, partial [Burkholderia pseudomallei]|nr:arylesterase [Burkholderia pseudomallei]
MDTTIRRKRRAALAALLSGALATTAAGLACGATSPAASPGQPVNVVVGVGLSAESGPPLSAGRAARRPP